jgi:hypothetical protein
MPDREPSASLNAATPRQSFVGMRLAPAHFIRPILTRVPCAPIAKRVSVYPGTPPMRNWGIFETDRTRVLIMNHAESHKDRASI